MSSILRKTHKFGLLSALYITLISSIIVGILISVFFEFSWFFLGFFSFFIFVFSFFIIQYRVERFIYRRVKKIYDDVSFLDSSTLKNRPITTDMTVLTRQVKKFATEKKLEIEMLKDREEYRREFLGNVSHELKTPLFTVQGYICTLLEGGMHDKKIRQKYLERAEKGVERLVYIVEDLDMIAKLEMEDKILDYSNFDIVELVQNVLDLLEMKANKKDITLTLDSKYYYPIMVHGDYEKIQQVVMNLIVNSIKYGKFGGSTEIGVEDLINNKVIVRIKDNGEGIESKNIPRLFERFYRVDKTGAREEGGSGLGLCIVKHIIEAHDEKIYVESTFNKGSEFSFTLEKAETILSK